MFFFNKLCINSLLLIHISTKLSFANSAMKSVHKVNERIVDIFLPQGRGVRNKGFSGTWGLRNV